MLIDDCAVSRVLKYDSREVDNSAIADFEQRWRQRGKTPDCNL